MERRGGSGLIIAGVIVMIVGLAIVATRVFGIAEYWVPVAVGAALVVAGLLRRGGMT